MTSTLRIRITVRGRLSQRLAPAFDGLALRRRGAGTDLVGEIVDHTQLHAVLTRVRDLGLELVSVSVTDADSTTPVGSNKCNKLEGGLP